MTALEQPVGNNLPKMEGTTRRITERYITLEKDLGDLLNYTILPAVLHASIISIQKHV